MSCGGDAEKPLPEPGVPAPSAAALARRLWWVMLYVGLAVVEVVSISPSAQYITLTFFASGHGGGDCELTPSSDPCRAAAGDAALYIGVSSGICSCAGAVMALCLGSVSDHLGRRPVLRLRTWLSLLPVVTLALHVFRGQTLWLFLIASPVFRAFDISGVLLAVISDLVPERTARAAAVGLFITFCIAVVMATLPLAGLLPIHAVVLVSLAATVTKVLFVYTLLPESSLSRSCESELRAVFNTPIAALKVFARHSFIFRMALVLILSSLGFAGVNTVLSSYMTAFLGLTRAEGSGLLLASVLSGAIGLAVGIGPLVANFGEVRALQACLAAATAFPVLLVACTTPGQVGVLVGVLGAPLFMLAPIVSGIKSNLVAQDEQGLVQGGLACVANLATATADVMFGFFYMHATEDGTAQSRSSVFPLFFLSASLTGVSWLLALSLPRRLPPPLASSPNLAGASAEAPLLGEDAAASTA